MTSQLPTNGTTVWVRRKGDIEDPFKATWDLTATTWTVFATSLTMPWYEVVRWRIL